MIRSTDGDFNTSHVKFYHLSVTDHYSFSHHFNTSHVKVYHSSTFFSQNSHRDFNTSHVKVYHTSHRGAKGASQISIHLMLRFIAFSLRRRLFSLNFNTSHVKVYLGQNYTVGIINLYFNTSHVKVYLLLLYNTREET